MIFLKEPYSNLNITENLSKLLLTNIRKSPIGGLNNRKKPYPYVKFEYMHDVSFTPNNCCILIPVKDGEVSDPCCYVGEQEVQRTFSFSNVCPTSYRVSHCTLNNKSFYKVYLPCLDKNGRLIADLWHQYIRAVSDELDGCSGTARCNWPQGALNIILKLGICRLPIDNFLYDFSGNTNAKNAWWYNKKVLLNISLVGNSPYLPKSLKQYFALQSMAFSPGIIAWSLREQYAEFGVKASTENNNYLESKSEELEYDGRSGLFRTVLNFELEELAKCSGSNSPVIVFIRVPAEHRSSKKRGMFERNVLQSSCSLDPKFKHRDVPHLVRGSLFLCPMHPGGEENRIRSILSEADLAFSSFDVVLPLSSIIPLKLIFDHCTLSSVRIVYLGLCRDRKPQIFNKSDDGIDEAMMHETMSDQLGVNSNNFNDENRMQDSDDKSPRKAEEKSDKEICPYANLSLDKLLDML